MKVTDEPSIYVMEGAWEPWSVIQSIVESGVQEDPFYVLDLGEVVARHRRWKELLPRVEPFYAVKCNDDKLLVSTLAALGTGFDCASKAEIELVTSLGVRPERIIYANPVKMESHLKFGKAVGVDTMTFDNEYELMKIKKHMPYAKLVIRIRCDAENVMNPLGVKFGCNPETEASRLLKIAAALQLDVIGVSFHIGTDAHDYLAFGRAIKHARTVFDLATSLGHTGMTLLDIGGGFPGTKDNSIEKVASIVNHAITKYFPHEDIRVIAEPGRYFAQAACTLAVMIYGKKEPRNILEKEVPCSIWGPSCDGIDCIVPATRLHALHVGEWLVTEEMGAYTTTTATTFNGFSAPRGYAVIDHSVWSSLKHLYVENGYCYKSTTLMPSPITSPNVKVVMQA